MSDKAKQAVIQALRAFVNRRPGFDLRNYASMSNYRGDQRPVQKQREIAHDLLNWIAWHDSITAADIIEAARDNFSGRLTINYNADKNDCTIDYCTGQYWPTEYRLAVVRVLSGLIWSYWRSGWENGKAGFREYAVKRARDEFGAAASKYFG